MLKFDEMSAPEDATALPEMIFVELMNSKPSRERLHPTEGAGYKVLGKTRSRRWINPQHLDQIRHLCKMPQSVIAHI